MIRIAIHGAAGRMGQGIAARCLADDQLCIHAMLESPSHPLLGQRLLDAPLFSARLEDAIGADVLLDFSHHAALPPLIDFCAQHQLRLLSGTTGIDNACKQRFAAAAQQVAMLWAPNTSVGVNVLLRLVRDAAAALGPLWDTEILELHHRRKKDAPSGTALALAEAARRNAQTQLVRSRDGSDCSRRPEELSVLALRGGDVVGEHTVFFISDGERIELSHRASDRAILINGAIHAARWLCDKGPGLYSMDQLLFGNAEQP